MTARVVVAGAVIADAALLIAQRRYPPHLAGCWELPGGKVASGETESAALARELAEELGVDAAAVLVGERLGADVALDAQTVLRAYRVKLTSGVPRPCDHQALRWVTAAQLADIAWVPADRAWLSALVDALTGA